MQEIPAPEAPQVLNLGDCGAPASWGDFDGAVRGASNACGHTLPPSGRLGGFVYPKETEGEGA